MDVSGIALTPASQELTLLATCGRPLRGLVGAALRRPCATHARSALYGLARFREGEAPSEPGSAPARREPRPPRIVQSHFGRPMNGLHTARATALILAERLRGHRVPAGLPPIRTSTGLLRTNGFRGIKVTV